MLVYSLITQLTQIPYCHSTPSLFTFTHLSTNHRTAVLKDNLQEENLQDENLLYSWNFLSQAEKVGKFSRHTRNFAFESHFRKLISKEKFLGCHPKDANDIKHRQ